MLEILDITTVLGFSLRLVIAIALGMAVGLERQWTKHQAGILTNVIVCVGAYSYSAFSYIAQAQNSVNIDVTRIAAQVVCGIGFLGAGLILRDGTNVRGLATAATIWTTAAIGILCTLSNLIFAIIVAIAIVVLHLILHPLSDFINKKTHYDKESRARYECYYKISISCKEENESDIRSHLIQTIRNKNGILLQNLESNEMDNGNIKIRAYVKTSMKNDDVVESVLAHIGKDVGVVSCSWKITD